MTRPALLLTCLLLYPAWVAHGSAAWAGPARMVVVPAGEVELLFPVQGEAEIPVEAFLIDAHPVTNHDYLRFLGSHPEWRRSSAPEVFVGSAYLRDWQSDLDFGALAPDAPITQVSWFAAAAYCEARGARLPKEAEWEYVARDGRRLGAVGAGASLAAEALSLTLARAEHPGAVGLGEANAWGVHDLHGLVWEWVLDIGSALNPGDSRGDADRRLQLFCAGGSIAAADLRDYAAFLRYAFRSALSGSYTSSGLGFRCAASL